MRAIEHSTLTMRHLSKSARYVLALVLLTPVIASAQTFTQAVGLFNVFVGLMVTGALLTYGIGFVIWFVRLGTWPTYRTEGIKIMEWSVVILFVLVLLLGIVQYVQKHPRAAGYLVAIVLGAIVVWIVVYLASRPAEKKKPE